MPYPAWLRPIESSPSGTRTPDLPLVRRMLYSTELRDRIAASGFEPLTSTVSRWRAPNCAKRPWWGGQEPPRKVEPEGFEPSTHSLQGWHVPVSTTAPWSATRTASIRQPLRRYRLPAHSATSTGTVAHPRDSCKHRPVAGVLCRAPPGAHHPSDQCPPWPGPECQRRPWRPLSALPTWRPPPASHLESHPFGGYEVQTAEASLC